jgi:hypothetical protein
MNTETPNPITSKAGIVDFPPRPDGQPMHSTDRLNHLATLDHETRLRQLEARCARADSAAAWTSQALGLVTQRLLDLPLEEVGRDQGRDDPLYRLLVELRCIGVHLSYLDAQMVDHVAGNGTPGHEGRAELRRPSHLTYLDTEATS